MSPSSSRTSPSNPPRGMPVPLPAATSAAPPEPLATPQPPVAEASGGRAAVPALPNPNAAEEPIPQVGFFLFERKILNIFISISIYF